MEVVAEAQFDAAFTFIFSARPGTAAAAMVDDFVPHEVIQERFNRLVSLQDGVSLEKNQQLVGKTVEVLSEGPSRKRPDVATTRTRTGKVVSVPGQHPSGSFLDVVIASAGHHSLSGSPA
jgi:tRNA-2-methylthio-N6-dimethylallyladenosine synthase